MLDRAEVYAMVDALGEVPGALRSQRPERLIKLYDELRLDLRYDHEERRGRDHLTACG